jgi:hypothetical protein
LIAEGRGRVTRATVARARQSWFEASRRDGISRR